MVLYLIFESAAGFALFELKTFDHINAKLSQVQKQINEMATFSTICHLKAFLPFTAETALHNALKVGEGVLTDDLKQFIESNIPKSKKKGKTILAFQDTKLAGKVSEGLGYECTTNESIFELFRGIRLHFSKFLKDQNFKENDLTLAQLGLAHSFSRNKVQFDVNRQDKPIIQSIAVLDLLDKDLNTFCMRLKEWYSWHFPELAKIVTDNEVYVKLIDKFGDKANITEDRLEEIEEIVGDGELALQVVSACNASMGQEFNEVDFKQISEFCTKTKNLFEFRKSIQEYLKTKMVSVAPNLTQLIGEIVGAKLISHAGGLTNLIKYPASTVQILGAEKALFQALKKKGNTPKYGLLYHSSFIGKAAGKDKGKISRFLANKCSLASRLDFFLINQTDRFGEKLKQQVEGRLLTLEKGGEMKKNIDVMEEVMEELRAENMYFENEPKPGKKSKKGKKKQVVEEVAEEEEVQPVVKSSKKRKQSQQEPVVQDEEVEVKPKKKKKKNITAE